MTTGGGSGRRARLVARCAAVLCVFLTAAGVVGAHERPMTDTEAAHMALRVRAEARHAWRGYMRYAAGHDELRPLSRTPKDWYSDSLLMTPVDALDTLVILGLNTEARQAQELIDHRLSFDHDMFVNKFEVTIRLLGGLLSAYQLTHDPRLLELADDLGRRLRPVFNSPTGIPWAQVNLHTGAVRGNVVDPAESGSLILEFGTLANLTGKREYYDEAKRALVAVYNRRSSLGLVGSAINIETGAWTDPDSHVGGGIDSYYEYLYKCWKLFGDEDCRRMWDTSIAAVNRYAADEVRGELWYGHADMRTGVHTASRYGALDAFFPGLLALSGDIGRARRLQASGLIMWRLNHLEPESLDYRTLTVIDGTYALRPEIIESAYYLYHYTGDPRYRAMGREFFADFVRRCRTPVGFAALADVRTGKQEDSMESYVLAEIFKYYYLLFAGPKALDFDAIVFNTEAHPLRRTVPAGLPRSRQGEPLR